MRILVVKLSSLGDIIQSYAAVMAIAESAPEAKIDWAVESGLEQLVETVPVVNRALSFPFRKRRWLGVLKQLWRLKKVRYDVVFDLQGNTKSALVTLLARSKTKVGFARQSVAEWPNLLVTNRKVILPNRVRYRGLDYLECVQEVFGKVRWKETVLTLTPDQEEWLSEWEKEHGERYTMVCPCSYWENKKMSSRGWVNFLEALDPTGHFVFIWGGEEEKGEVEELAAYFPKSRTLGRLPMPLWQNLMRKMKAVASVDSCALHLAASAGVPTYSFFGASSRAAYAPFGELHQSYQGICPYGVTFERRCPRLRTCKTGACMKALFVLPSKTQEVDSLEVDALLHE